MTATLCEHTQFVDSSGKPLVGGFLTIGDQNAAPATNLKNIFSDRDLTVALSNPQTLDSLGRATNKIWTDGKYSMLVQDSNSVQIYLELDNGSTTSTGETQSLSNVSGGNTITAEAALTITSLSNLNQFSFTTASVNTGAVTLNIDGVGAKTIKKNHDEDLVTGDFDAGQSIVVIYNSTDDTFEWTNSGGGGTWEFISSALASTSASLLFTGMSSTHAKYALFYSQLISSAASDQVNIQLGDSGGLKTTLYEHAVVRNSSGTQAVVGSGSTSSTGIQANGITAGTGTNDSTSGVFYIDRPIDGVSYPLVNWKASSWLANTVNNGSGAGVLKTVITMTQVSIFFTDGNIVTGRATLLGLKHV